MINITTVFTVSKYPIRLVTLTCVLKAAACYLRHVLLSTCMSVCVTNTAVTITNKPVQSFNLVAITVL